MAGDPAGGLADASAAGPVRAGLDSVEAARRLAADGPNRLPARGRSPVPLLLLREMVHFFALLLWGAAALALLAGMPQLAVAIVVVVLLNGVFAFAQEYRADQASRRLRELIPADVTVRRDGRRTVVHAADLVAGDVVLLEAGDRISADLHLAEVHALAVNESMLTGESVPARPRGGDAVFAGTFVVEGQAEAVVTATGARTRLAAIAALTQAARRPPSPLARRLGTVIKVVAAIALGVGTLFFALTLLLGMAPTDGFLLALGAEPANPRTMDGPARTGALLDRRLLVRVFGVLGPAQAVVEMAAFTAVLALGGWALGADPDPALLAAASGTAFAAVVLGQLANAFACRSQTRWAGSLPWRSNRLLLGAVASEAVLLLVFLGSPPLAGLLGGALPPPAGWALAALAVPAVIGADALHKALRRGGAEPGAVRGLRGTGRERSG
ncbi:HAD-IC family P-type ATPase [Planomonospora sp. ID82291]|uniref:cation-translocating P-type ATPase n=1 Tax=Planomonospora sp. ID82291 TaxID=2738136 RepID=UPI001A31F577|nr:HAD-IC family P-type ATPase [Planomonospora sp. ID82291]MBG0816670.1 HAD-IC family P-type ATPase [Planomonospora sp. ID82291]